MNKILVVVVAFALVCIAVMPVFAVHETGNGSLSGQHYNLNIIGVPNRKNTNFNGGQGSRIFVLRTGTTKFYVGASNNFEIVDHDATDGVCGTAGNPGVPGILFPYSGGEWRVQIYVRLLGPKTSQVKWKSYYFDGVEYIKWAEFTIDRDSKFSLKTGQLLMDGYENILWEMYDKVDFRLLQMRIYLEDT